MSGNFESLPYERFSAVMTIHTSAKQDRIWPKIGFGASIAQDVSNAGCGLPGCAMQCDNVAKHQSKQEIAGGYDGQQRAQSG